MDDFSNPLALIWSTNTPHIPYKLEPHKLCFYFTQLTKITQESKKEKNREKKEIEEKNSRKNNTRRPATNQTHLGNFYLLTNGLNP